MQSFEVRTTQVHSAKVHTREKILLEISAEIVLTKIRENIRMLPSPYIPCSPLQNGKMLRICHRAPRAEIDFSVCNGKAGRSWRFYPKRCAGGKRMCDHVRGGGQYGGLRGWTRSSGGHDCAAIRALPIRIRLGTLGSED